LQATNNQQADDFFDCLQGQNYGKVWVFKDWAKEQGQLENKFL